VETTDVPTPSQSMRTKLLDLYSSRVDSVYRISHWPATLLQIRNDDPADRALEYSIYFMALCTLADAEMPGRQKLLDKYRSATETLLSRANLVIPNMTALHAFVIYLVSSLPQLGHANFLACAANVSEQCFDLDIALTCSTDRHGTSARKRSRIFI
jgi:hypothetical protein